MIKDYSLYVVISEEYAPGRKALAIADSAIAGGADIIQLREKSKAAQELNKLACAMAALCREKGVTFIVNDDPYLAMESNADGVHLGQDDLRKFGINKTRQIIGERRIIGVSTHSLEQVHNACRQDVDYIAFGPIFPTQTKDYCIGKENIKEAARTVQKPLVLIGGINLTNISQILEEGGKNIALIRGVLQADDIRQATKAFKDKLLKAKAEHDYKNKR